MKILIFILLSGIMTLNAQEVLMVKTRPIVEIKLPNFTEFRLKLGSFVHLGYGLFSY